LHEAQAVATVGAQPDVSSGLPAIASKRFAHKLRCPYLVLHACLLQSATINPTIASTGYLARTQL
jgi:hypothetical protein